MNCTASRPTVSVVTGAGGAMGAACAAALAAASDTDVLVLTDLEEGRLRTAVQQVESSKAAPGHPTVSAIVGDLLDSAFTSELAARTSTLGRLGALVHTAGLSPSMASWDDILRVDLVASSRLLDAFEPLVERASVGVCIASIAGHVGRFDPAEDQLLAGPFDDEFETRFLAVVGNEPDAGITYRLAKRGVLQLCERAAISWGQRGGRVVSVSPGLIDTAMGRLELTQNPIKTWMAEITPVGHGRGAPDSPLPGIVDDVARVVAFLCSDDAAFVSGCDIRVDGGLVSAMDHHDPAAGGRP